MTAHVFVDTNVFVYAHQVGEPQKQPLAAAWIERLWAERTGCTSIQVLNECYSALTRRTRPIQHSSDAWHYVTRFIAWNPLPVNDALAFRAREVEQRYGLNWWDCLIVAAAQMQNCSMLLTEDLQDRAMYGPVSVHNPFKDAVCDSSVPEMYGVDPGFAVRRRWHRRSIRPRAQMAARNHVGL